MRYLFFASMATALCCFLACQEKKAPKMTGLAGGLQDSTIVRLWPHEIDSLLKTDPNVPFIDVRTELEFRTSHIYRALNCDFNAPDFAERIQKLGLQTPVILYDDGSFRSLQAAEKMHQMGFKRVYELSGGIYTWASEGKTLVSGASKIDSSTILR